MPLNTDYLPREREGRMESGRAGEAFGAPSARDTRPARASQPANEPSLIRVLAAIRDANEQADEAVIHEAEERYLREMTATKP